MISYSFIYFSKVYIEVDIDGQKKIDVRKKYKHLVTVRDIKSTTLHLLDKI